jgi:hypothetical protein
MHAGRHAPHRAGGPYFIAYASLGGPPRPAKAYATTDGKPCCKFRYSPDIRCSGYRLRRRRRSQGPYRLRPSDSALPEPRALTLAEMRPSRRCPRRSSIRREIAFRATPPFRAARGPATPDTPGREPESPSRSRLSAPMSPHDAGKEARSGGIARCVIGLQQIFLSQRFEKRVRA